jgi:hypothetical protein
MLLCFELVEDEVLDCFGFERGGELTVAELL